MLSVTTILYILVVLGIFTFLQALTLMLGSRRAMQAASLRRKAMADGVSPWLAELLLTRRVADFEMLVRGSGVAQSPTNVLTGMAVAVLIVVLGFTLAGYNALYSLAAGLVAGGLLPLLVLKRLRSRRFTKLTVQLPEALDMLVRSLRAGLPVPIGIGMIGREMPDPVASEFRQVSDALSYGLGLKDALEELGRRLPIAEVTYMVAAIRVQYSTGGNLSEVLSSLADVMRERTRFKMKVKALSAESRVSGNIMMLVPFLMIGGMLYLRPEFYKDVPESSLLQMVLGGAAVLLAIGILLMRRIVNVRA